MLLATSSICLISNNNEERERAIRSITDDGSLQSYLRGDAQQLLRKLKLCQSELDSSGVLDIESHDDGVNICKAMTLRDCTLFLKKSGDQIEARFADLDLKLPEKIAQWKKVEKSLIDEGWYTNAEDEADWSRETICLLSKR